MVREKEKNITKRQNKNTATLPLSSSNSVVSLFTALRLFLLKIIVPLSSLFTLHQGQKTKMLSKQIALATMTQTKLAKRRKSRTSDKEGGQGGEKNSCHVRVAVREIKSPTKVVRTLQQFKKEDTQKDKVIQVAPRDRFTLRVPVSNATVSSRFGYRIHPLSKKRKLHRGMDWAAKAGTPIAAAESGKVIRAHYSPSFGHCVKIRHRNGFETTYAHLKRYQVGIRKGTHVKKGTVIGFVGTTGHSTGPHLHFEVTKNGKHVDPRFYLV